MHTIFFFFMIIWFFIEATICLLNLVLLLWNWTQIKLDQVWQVFLNCVTLWFQQFLNSFECLCAINSSILEVPEVPSCQSDHFERHESRNTETLFFCQKTIVGSKLGKEEKLRTKKHKKHSIINCLVLLREIFLSTIWPQIQQHLKQLCTHGMWEVYNKFTQFL